MIMAVMMITSMCLDESLQLHKEPGGTTAIVALIKNGWIVCVSAPSVPASYSIPEEVGPDHKFVSYLHMPYLHTHTQLPLKFRPISG